MSPRFGGKLLGCNRPVEVAAGQEHPRAHQLARLNALLHLEELRQPRHQPHAGDTVRDQQHFAERGEPRYPRVAAQVQVHVPQARNQELAGAVHDLRAGGDGSVSANCRDAVAGDHDGHARLGGGAGAVDERHVAHGQGLGLRRRRQLRDERGRQRQQDQEETPSRWNRHMRAPKK